MKVGDEIKSERGAWRFGEEVAEKFDMHVEKSVPLYHEGHELICNLSDFFIKPGSAVYEIGCSTGTLTLRLASHHQHCEGVQFCGLDIEADMTLRAEQRLRELSPQPRNVTFTQADVLDAELEPADMAVCYYTLQFIPPATRQAVVDKLYRTLNWGGGLVVFEKTRAPDARFQDLFSALYTDYKLEQGYSPDEIVGKARSLRGVLEPFSTQGNIDMFKRAGFVDIVSVQKYTCFEGFLAIK